MGVWMYADGLGTVTEVTQVPTENVGTVILNFIPDAGQCANEVPVTFTIVAPPTVNISGETSFCQGRSTLLTAEVDPSSVSASYQWLKQTEDADKWQEISGATDVTYQVSEAGNYMVEVTTEAGCIVTSGEHEVTMLPNPTVTVTNNGQHITYGQSINNITVSCPNGTLTGPDATIIPEGLTVVPNAVMNEMTISGTPAAGTYNLVFTGTNGCGNVTETVTIEVDRATVTIQIVGNTDTKEYNCSEQQVNGYDLTIPTGVNILASEISCSDLAEAKGTNVGGGSNPDGSYPMGLVPSFFSCTNENYTVSFEVTDGWLNITTAPLTVHIYGENAEYDYNGEEHTLTGYHIGNA